MKTPLRAAVLSALILSAAAAAPAALAQTAGGDAVFRATTLQLAAEGEMRIAPDMASLQLGVTAEAPTAGEAMQRNAEQMTRAIAALRRAGIAEKDIRTSSLNLSPQYAYEQNQPPRLTGYRAANQVTITVRDLRRLGSTLDAAVASGANDIGGISLGLADPTSAQDAARQAAVKALAAKAELYAQATGHRVLRLVSLSEGEPVFPVPMMAAQPMAMRKMAEATPISPGEMPIKIQVTGVYELAR